MIRMVRIFAFFAAINTALAVGQQTSPGGNEGEALSGIGPWGQLEISEIPLTCPDHILRVLDIPSSQSEWVFEQPSIEELQVYLSLKGLSEKEISYIIGNSGVIHDPTLGTRLFPKDELIRDMTLALRQKFYRILATNPQNRFYHRPVFMNTGNVSEWSRESGISRSVQSDIAQLAYPTPRKRGYFLSDVPFLLRQAESSPEELVLLRALMRRPALIVHLKLDATSDLVALSEYWTAGFKNKDILPLMESVVSAKEIDRVDIAHFLPPTARRNLLAFPQFAEGASGRYPDWFWTCYNFFRFTPEDIYADAENLEVVIAREFSVALSPLQFGDMLLIRNGEKAIHGCIYIAEDIVYTKNRPDIFSPWILMRIDDLLAYHDMTGDAEVTIHRKRQLPLQ